MSLALALLLLLTDPKPEGLSARLRSAGLEVSEVTTFLETLKAGLGRHDRPGVCALVSYPIVATAKRVRDAAACRRDFEALFNDKVKAAVLSQKPEDLLANSRGVMIGRGEIWFSGICKDRRCRTHTLKIVAINNFAPR
jgi:hypothetical protein